jgi:putative ABC transport system permease protein
MNNWGWENFLVYFDMQDNFLPSEVAEKCNQLILKHRPLKKEDPSPDYSLQNLKAIHLYSSHFGNDIQPQNSITYVLIFSTIGLLVLLIACFNYVNLLTANAASRAKEIGIRKVEGAGRGNLVFQFMGESYVILSVAFAVSLVLVKVMLPLFNSLSNKTLQLSSLLHMNHLFPVLGILVITGVFSGFYPAFILSGIQPREAMTLSRNFRSSKFNVRKIFVGIQFTIVIILVCSGILMFRQINFLQHKELGFNQDYTLISRVNSFDNIEKYKALKQELLNESIVKNVSAASRIPSDPLNNRGTVLPDGQTQEIVLPFVHVDFDYFETLGIKASQGRLFSNNIETDIRDAVILNTSAVKKLGIQNDPIGQTVSISWPPSSRRIIGILNLCTRQFNL